MKKLFTIFVLTVLLFPLCSCNDDDNEVIYDFAPIVLDVAVVDQKGNSLLSEDYENNIVGTSVTFADEEGEYPVDWEIYKKQQSRAYLPIFYGAVYAPAKKWDGTKWEPSDEWRIYFGELDGSKNIDRTFIVEICGQKFDLRVTNKLKWKKNKPEIDRHFYLNGIEQENSSYNLVINTAS